jgi:hypothetical protein
VVAAGSKTGLITSTVFSVLVVVVLITTLVTPLILRFTFSEGNTGVKVKAMGEGNKK